MQLRVTVFKLLKCEAEVVYKWDVDAKWNAHAESYPPMMALTPPSTANH